MIFTWSGRSFFNEFRLRASSRSASLHFNILGKPDSALALLVWFAHTPRTVSDKKRRIWKKKIKNVVKSSINNVTILTSSPMTWSIILVGVSYFLWIVDSRLSIIASGQAYVCYVCIVYKSSTNAVNTQARASRVAQSYSVSSLATHPSHLSFCHQKHQYWINCVLISRAVIVLVLWNLLVTNRVSSLVAYLEIFIFVQPVSIPKSKLELLFVNSNQCKMELLFANFECPLYRVVSFHYCCDIFIVFSDFTLVNFLFYNSLKKIPEWCSLGLLIWAFVNLTSFSILINPTMFDLICDDLLPAFLVSFFCFFRTCFSSFMVTMAVPFLL